MACLSCMIKGLEIKRRQELLNTKLTDKKRKLINEKWDKKINELRQKIKNQNTCSL